MQQHVQRSVWRLLPPLPPLPLPARLLSSRAAQPRRLRHPTPPANAHKKNPAPRLRVADQHVAALVARRSSSSSVVAACRALAAKEQVGVLAATDMQAWNVALQHRLAQDDVAGARALLALVGSFDAANTSAQLWADLLFTLLRQHQSALSDGNEVKRLLDALRDAHGADFIAHTLASVVNGCAKLAMFDQARFLVLYSLALGADALPLPPRVVGNLVSVMAAKRRHADVVAFTTDLFAYAHFGLADFPQQSFIALFQSCARARESPARAVAHFLQWVRAQTRGSSDAPASSSSSSQRRRTEGREPPHALERVFGAAIQCCVETEQPRLALRCYDAIRSTNDSNDTNDSDPNDSKRRPIPIDENIYVNVLKACAATADAALFKDVYRAMMRDGVARGPGVGSAIRFCALAGDVAFLEEVLDDAFALEDALQGAWMLAVEQYNDALGCFARARRFELGKDLFARMAQNPFVAPDRVTMLEVVENHRDAPFADVFELMEFFLERGLGPDLKVFTSLLAMCARRRLVGDAVALVDAMRAQGIAPDLKTYTVVAFVHGTHADVGRIVDILATMAATRVATDDLFFEYVMNALYGASGIDVCFQLLRELRAANVPVPGGLYNALVDVGTRAGLVERTLHVAYNMECDGFALSSPRMRALITRCGSTAEMTELLRTFELLHQGAPPPAADAAAEGEPRFDADVYEDVIDLLARFNKRDVIPKIRKLAEDAGHDVEHEP
ncbi:hypothetical protein PybrP1_008946 [[Pythium] brassicae (nom. inval.)]|nr:hypothetical protein PybrP1_008946 [[Pythium] brassicae (nom. inval.)]